MPMETASYEPQPFSAHFHVEGKTIDELHQNTKALLEKHVKPKKKVQQYKGKHHKKRTTVAEALS